MNKFTDAWKRHQEETVTENGALTYTTSADSNVDLYFTIAAMRTAPVERLYQTFAKAFGENPYIATRILLWARDVRGGAGERRVFRELIQWLELNDTDVLELVLPKIPELGRWDDVLVFKTDRFKKAAYEMVDSALRAGNGLCAKWMPRRGPIAEELRKFFKLTPRQYRKVLVKITNVVETQMCANEWGAIDYEKVPSLAQARYAKAFKRHDQERYETFGAKAKAYAEYVVASATRDALVPSESVPEKVTINAGAVYPYDVLKNLVQSKMRSYGYGAVDSSFDPNVIRAQWLTLPNYVGSKNILAMPDVSGSMQQNLGSDSLQAIDVSVSLALYIASKNTGAYKNMFLSFTSTPQMVSLKGDDIVGHVQQLATDRWHGSTNLAAGFDNILKHALENDVPQADMPEYIIVFSDMEFDSFGPGKTAQMAYEEKFRNAGYRAPKIVWWNIVTRNENVPVVFDKSGTALVSGMSPTLLKNVLSGESISPVSMMMRTIMDPRYDLDMVKKAA